MAGAPHSRATTVNDADRNSQSAPDLVAYPNQFFFWLYRESVAVFSFTLASEFLPIKEFTFVPEGSGQSSFVADIKVGHIFNRLRFFQFIINCIPQLLVRLLTSITVNGQTPIALEFFACLPASAAPFSVNVHDIVPKVRKKVLSLYVVHQSSSSSPLTSWSSS
jgi:hypothetical protein